MIQANTITVIYQLIIMIDSSVFWGYCYITFQQLTEPFTYG